MDNKGLKKLIIDEIQFKEIRKLLANLRKKSNVDCIILIDESGQPLCSSLKDPEIQIAAISALTAGNFAAANELSKLLGEKEVKSLLQEGEKLSIYSYKVLDKFILLIVFSSEIRFGMVKLYAHQTIKQLEEILKGIVYEPVEIEKPHIEEPKEQEIEETVKEKETEKERESTDDLDSVLLMLKEELEKSLKEEDK